MVRYRLCLEPRTKKYVKWCGFLSFPRNFLNKYQKYLLDAGIDALKTACKKVVYKAAEATDELRGNKIAEKIVKPKHVNDENPRNVEEIIVTSKKEKQLL